jgi:hypothetical protein
MRVLSTGTQFSLISYRNNKNIDVPFDASNSVNKNRKRKSRGSKKQSKTKEKYFDPLDFEKVMSDLRTQSISCQLPKDPPFGIKDDCLMQYKCAIKQLRHGQVAQERNTNAWEFVWTDKCQKVFTSVKSRRRRVAIANCDEKFDYDTI